jgi:hypothetical protein
LLEISRMLGQHPSRWQSVGGALLIASVVVDGQESLPETGCEGLLRKDRWRELDEPIA